MRAVIDTNVFIHGMLGSHDRSLSRACETILNRIAMDEICPVMNPPMLEEYIHVSSLRTYSTGRAFSKTMRGFASFAAAAEHLNHNADHWNPSWIYDPTDKMFVECAISGDVRYVVSNDYALKKFVDWNRSQNHVSALGIIEDHGIEFYSPETFVQQVLQPIS